MKDSSIQLRPAGLALMTLSKVNDGYHAGQQDYEGCEPPLRGDHIPHEDNPHGRDVDQLHFNRRDHDGDHGDRCP